MIYLGIFAIGFIASFINSIAGGGGGILSIPFLILLGLPPQVAVATNRFGALGMGASTIYQFFRNRKIIFRYIVPLAVISVAGGLIGANILVRIDEEFLGQSVGVLILLVLPVIFLKKEIGTEQKKVSIRSKIAAYLSYFFLSVYDSFFGAGSGLVAIFILASMLGMTYLEANGTDKVAWILNALISVVIFASYNLINYKFGLVLLSGMFVGGYIGASTAIKKGDGFVRIFLTIAIIISAAKLLFF